MPARHIIEAAYALAAPGEMQTFAGDVNWKGKVVMMPTRKFLSLVPPRPAWAPSSDERVDTFKRRISAGDRLDPLVLVVRDGRVVGHEGRHRAAAAFRLGIDEVPVLVIPRDYPRYPEWTPDMHAAVERADFSPEEF